MNSRFWQEPYRLFFPLGILIGFIGIGHWLIYGIGWSHSYSGFFHANLQMQGYMSCFVFGFLMTALPRFTSSAPTTRSETLLQFFLMLSLVAAYSFEQFIIGEILFMLLLAHLVLFAVRRVKKKPSHIHPPVEFIWILSALAHGLIGCSILIAAQIGWMPKTNMTLGAYLVNHGFLLSIVLGVGSFLGPRIMGTFKLDRMTYDSEQKKVLERKKKRRLIVHLSSSIILFTSYFLMSIRHFETGALMQALLISFIFFWTGTLTIKPKVTDLYVKLLCLSFWFIFVGAWAVVFMPTMKLALYHLLFIGGYTLMTFAVATMVIMSHGGMPHKLRDRSWRLSLLGAFILIALIIRIVCVAFPEWYFSLLGIVATIWMVGAILWLSYVSPYLGRMPDSKTVEQAHEEAKKRVLGDQVKNDGHSC